MGLRMKTLGYAVIFLFCSVFPACAQLVYHGCTTPPSKFGNVWYIDPVKGATQIAGGTGSATHPWNSLQAVFSTTTGYNYPLLTTAPYKYWPKGGSGYVFAAGPSAGPIKPGDEILLMGGNYGTVNIGQYNTEIANSSFLTIAAAPGQTPVFSLLAIESTTMLQFIGIKVQSLAAGSSTFLVSVKDQGSQLPASNIVFQNMTLSSQDDVTSWSQADWRTNARNGFVAQSSAGGGNTKCISMTGSHITNIKTGVSLGAALTVFSGNQIDHFADDGIEFAASDLSITKNYIHDNLDIADGVHTDAMQGQIGVLPAGVAVNTYSNILIDSNTVIRQIDPNLPFPQGLQGIDAFDSNWQYLTVSNNVVVTSSCYGIGFASVNGGLIVNNTTVADGLLATAGNCKPGINIGDKTHQGSSSQGVTVRNNLTNSVSIDNLDPGVTADHNVGMATSGTAVFSWYVNGVTQFFGAPGSYGSNIIAAGGPAAEFVDFDPALLTYNLKLKANVPAVTAGTAANAPTVDIIGVPRTSVTTTTSPPQTGFPVGAYGYPE